ncbi:MAG TPA: glycosyltransferase family 4 protein [Gemmatimonadaceae bacterium]|nr:glycosyltransferase family 4 protein [Gemmatimonadaceae bacterium]
MIDVLVVSHACVTAINRIPWRRLAELGWTVEIVTAPELVTREIVRRADPPQPDDPPLHFLPLSGPNLRFWRFVGLRALIARRRPKIVMLDYDPGTLITLETGMALAGSGAHIACLSYDNIVRRVTDELRQSPAAGARTMTVRAMSALAARFVDHVFVLSSDSAEVMHHFGFAGRTSRIPLGFDPALFRPDEATRSRVRAELGLHSPTFAYFGRVVPEKGAHLLLEALARMRDREWQLLLDHFSDYKHPYVRELAEAVDRLGLRDRVVYFDAPHERMGEYMNAADIVVMPSRSTPRWKEQYGRVAQEAMACGKVVVVSTSGALPELVGDAGVVVPEEQLDRLDVALRGLLEDAPLRERLGRLGAARAHEQLSLTVQVRLIHERFLKWSAPSRA